MRTRNSTRAAAAVQARKARASVMQTRSATGAKARKNNSRSSNVKKPSKQNLQQARKSANVRSNRRKAPARKQMSESNSVAGYLSKNLEQILRYLPNNLRNTLLDIEANENEPSVPFAAASSQNIKSAGITFRGHIEPKTTSKAAQSRLLNQGKLWTQKFLEDHLKLLERSVPTTVIRCSTSN
ncbi:hypothetical protein GYMLUDRAFT_595550 [Collybiopsis luxurians FD-317 M1]|uniref:Uncharacterized protein n=1 Tax=Collybiopsis luxurians FD-317 M1 TaxID=944289 RepID=A0A0D0CPI3_9AGAR|nr:hypothetical protein GYMLUDRAFT_595550 [Collybiopsis luxurians FD-317 M1]